MPDWKEMESLARLWSLVLMLPLCWVWVEAAPLLWAGLEVGAHCSGAYPTCCVHLDSDSAFLCVTFLYCTSPNTWNPTSYEASLDEFNLVSHLRLFPLHQCFSDRGSFAPPSFSRNSWTYLETFLVVICGVAVCWWHLEVEARDAATHPTMHRTVPTTKNALAQRSVVLKLINPDLEA